MRRGIQTKIKICPECTYVILEHPEEIAADRCCHCEQQAEWLQDMMEEFYRSRL